MKPIRYKSPRGKAIPFSSAPKELRNAEEIDNVRRRRELFDESPEIKALEAIGAEVFPTAGFARDDWTVAIQTRGKKSPTQFAEPGDWLTVTDGLVTVIAAKDYKP